MATANSPKLSVTLVARVMTNGHYFHCLSCHGNVNGSLITEEDIARHMATQHRNRVVRYWMVNDNSYTNSFDEYCQWMNINN